MKRMSEKRELKQSVEEWKDLRFGMFIHWGLYALLGRGEWVMFNEAIDKDEYRTLMEKFSAEKFDARKWALTAKEAGMKYMVLTARHHDGFSLWDSKGSADDFTSMRSAARRDFVKEYVEACRDAGLKVGLYYSPLDWRLPGYFFPRMYAKSAKQLRDQCHEQIRELLTQYGKIDLFWFDGGEDFWLCHGCNLHKPDGGTDIRANPQSPGFWGAAELDRMIRTLQPGIVVNNRYGDREFGDFLTPEETIGEFNTQEAWESNMTLNGSWGWVPRPACSLRECIHRLVKSATGDGNLLLNVGPRADGGIEESHRQRLQEIGDWLQVHGDSIYGTRGGPYRNNHWGGMTHRGNTLYVHIWDWLENTVTLGKLDAEIQSVSSATAKGLQYTMKDGVITLSVSEEDRLALDTVIQIELDRPVSSLLATGAWCSSSENNTPIHAALIVEQR